MKTGPGGCTSGPVCDSYKYQSISAPASTRSAAPGALWANGVKYCCAQNRDYGFVSLSISNGVITCDCYRLTKETIDRAKDEIDEIKVKAKETIDWAKETIQKTMTALSKLFSFFSSSF